MSDSYGTYDGRRPEPPYPTAKEGASSVALPPDVEGLCQILETLAAADFWPNDPPACLREAAGLLRSQAQQIAEMRERLKAFEWGDNDGGYCLRCFVCGHSKEHGHSEDCAFVARLLKEGQR